MNYLLTIQIGPVQDFIAAARTTRDLWSGSYMLSYLMASTISIAKIRGMEIIFPNPYLDDNKTLKILELVSDNVDQKSTVDKEGYLLPTLPNKLLLKIKCTNFGDIKNIATSLERVPIETLKSIGESVKNNFWQAINTNRFDMQLNSFLEIYWAAVEIEGTDISKSYKKLNKIVSAAKNLRFFSAINKSWSIDKCGNRKEAFQENGKDFLTGRDENVILSYKKFYELDSNIRTLIREDEKLGAVNLVKRLWHITYLHKIKKIPERWFVMPCIYDIAEGNTSKNSSETVTDIIPYNYKYDSSNIGKELKKGNDPINKYYAVIAFDGDKIGKWISGEVLKKRQANFVLDESYLKEFSDKLNQFTRKAKEVVEGCRGKLIYAGGDDVLALLPSEICIDCAQRLNQEFGKLKIRGVSFESSCGIAIGHVKIPLQDIVKEAQISEKDAKNIYDRNSLSIHILKRNGEIIKWGSKFDQKRNFNLLNTLISYKNDSDIPNGISRKFLYDFIKCLLKYVSNGTKNAPILSDLDISMILKTELESTMESKPIPSKVKEKLQKAFDEVVHNTTPTNGDFSKNTVFVSLISLFQVAAWIGMQDQK